MPTATPNYVPQGERLLEGTITSGQLSAAATSCDVSNPPSADKLPTYFEFEPDNADNRETVRVTDVSGSTITFERGVYNAGTGKIHAANSAYKQKITEKHWTITVDSIQDGWLKEDTSLTLTRDSATQFTITGIDHTAYYTAGRFLRFNESDSNIARVKSSQLSGSDTVVTLSPDYAIPGTLTTVEIAVSPRGATYLSDLLDANGNESIKLPATTSAVNEVTIRNAATGNAPSVEATGDDTNIDLKLLPKGTGKVDVAGVYKLPAADGSASQVLQTDGAGALSFATVGGAMSDEGAYVKPNTDGDSVRAYDGAGGSDYTELDHDGTDGKVNAGAGHLVLTPASSKLVKITVLEQNGAGTNTYRNNSIILTGWNTVNGGGSLFFQQSQSFGVTFSTVPVVVGSPAGRDTVGAKPTTLNAHTEYNGYTTFDAVSISTTGFQGCISACAKGDGGANSLGSGSYYAFTWIAIGTL